MKIKFSLAPWTRRIQWNISCRIPWIHRKDSHSARSDNAPDHENPDEGLGVGPDEELNDGQKPTQSFLWQHSFNLGRFLDLKFTDALERWNPRRAQRWLFLGANPEGESYPGIPFACRAARLGSVHIFQSLIEYGADPERASHSGWKPIHFAALKDHSAIIHLLHKYQVNLNDVVSPDWSPLIIATRDNRIEAVEALCLLGADLNLLDDKKRTALSLCSIKGFEEVASVLIKYKANYMIRDSKGFTPFHQAASRGFFHICKSLVEAGASPLLEGPWNKTPLDWARSEGEMVIYAFLEKAVIDQNLKELGHELPSESPKTKARRL